ncbi:hypothetical protein BYT27DRAFT_7174064 [Phlegmacium glaucopus]|nr:hypothetical protein BYT27DRAFT_7174064 [Phlegmacium glaucopus]
MPQVYHSRLESRRRRSTSSASSSSTSTVSTGSMRPTDADDSIVLSDLVRTGEASRLRRRGAMRIDHGAITSTSSHPYATTRPPSPTMIIADRPSWDLDYDPDSQTVLEGHLYRDPSSRFSRIRPRSSRRHGPHDTVPYTQLQDKPDEYVYTLACGAKITDLDLDDEVEPFKPSILPLYPPLASSSNEKSIERNTGCGTVVHMHAAPRSRVGMWTARSAAPSSVITLEASYFATREAAKFTRSACGCVKEGVGCAVCGNPLGIRYTPCKAAADSFFLPCNNRKPHAADTSTRLRGPEGPQYWQPSSSRLSADHTIYTFFPDAVTSTPQYDLSATKPVVRQRAYSDPSIDLVSSPSTVTQAFPSGTEGDFYTGTEEINGVPEWDQLGEGYGRDLAGLTPRNHPDEGEEETEEITGGLRPDMILDRFSLSSPVPFSETGDENVSATTATVDRGPWGFPSAFLRRHTRGVTQSPGLHFRSFNDGNGQRHLQYDHESFYQQQVLGAWEREREVEEMDRTRNVDNDGWSVSVSDVRWGFDPDGESEVWGVVDAEQSWAADPYDSESADKSTEGPLFPER